MLENKPEEETNISKIENEIHELSHIVHSQFFITNQTVCEGFAETLPLYALGIEEVFDEHRNALIELEEIQILSVQELLNSEKNGTYGAATVLPNKSCSFRLSYISSYLFVRGCVETIAEKNNLSQAKAIQYFLDIVKQSNCTNEWLIYDIANAIGLSQNDILNNKQLQMKVLSSLSTKVQKSSFSK